MKGAIFDVDGTILDSMWVWDSLSIDYLLSMGINPRKNLNKCLKSLSFEEGCLYIKKTYELEISLDKIKKDMEATLADYYANYFDLKPYVLETLEELKNKNVKIAIATAIDEDLVSMALNRHGILDYFEFIQTEQNVGLSKSNPEFFKVAINRLGIEPNNIWVFEDALHCIISAKKCNLNVVAIKDKSALNDLIKIKDMSNIYIDNLSKLNLDKLW